MPYTAIKSTKWKLECAKWILKNLKVKLKTGKLFKLI